MFLIAAFLFGVVSCGDPIKPENPVTPVTPQPEKDAKAPTISVSNSSVNVIDGMTVTLSAGKLTIGSTDVASWSDDKTAADKCTVSLSFVEAGATGSTAVSSGATLAKAGKLTLKVSDESGNASSSDITIEAYLADGVESLNTLELQVDKETNLLQGIKLAEGVSLEGVEIEIGGVRSPIADPQHFAPEFPEACVIIMHLKSVGGKTEEIKSNTLAIKPLEYAEFSVAKADIESGLESDSIYSEIIDKGRENLRETGVYKMQALLVEMIENGTATMSSQEVKALLSRNQLVMEGEQLYKAPGFENLYEFIEGSWTEYELEVHGDEVGKRLMANVKKVLEILGLKMQIYSKSPITNFQHLLEHVQNKPHQVFYFFTSSPVTSPIWSDGVDGWNDRYKDERIAIQQLSNANNVYCLMASAGNLDISEYDTDEGAMIYMIIKSDEQDTVNGYYSIWSDGGDGVMGANNVGITHSYTHLPQYNAWSKHPSKKNVNDPKLWNDSSQLYGTGQEATSWATPVAAGKYYLQSLANQLVNPDITNEENRALIRASALDGTVLVDGEHYGTTKRVYPGAAIAQFFSSVPSSVSLGSDELIPIPQSLYKNSIIVGPSVVAATSVIPGSDPESFVIVTSDNYKDLIGTQLYLSPRLLRKYGFKPGDTLELTQYLCTDSAATGAWGVTSEAGKAIDEKKFTVKLD